jgi:hypothetical protein
LLLIWTPDRNIKIVDDFPSLLEILKESSAMTVPDKATVETIQLKGTVNEEVKAPRDSAQEAAARGQGVSGYEKLSVLHTIKKFKVNSLVCFLVTLSAATDGYQIGCVPCLRRFSVTADSHYRADYWALD